MKKNILFIANWKMNLSAQETAKLLDGIMGTAKKSAPHIKTVIAPSFPFLRDTALNVVRRHASLELCGQDCFWQQSGAYTGEVSSDMLADIGCTYVLLGHSERRMYLLETDEMIQKKLACVYATKKRITPVLCIGETAQQKKEGRSDDVIYAQISAALKGIVLKKNQKLVIAYEPIWAIGTGDPMTADAFGVCVLCIRKILGDILGTEVVRKQCSILYGGSVTPQTAPTYISAGGDGVLVGGASQKIDSCIALIQKLAVSL